MTFEEALDAQLAQVRQILLTKHRDYGAANIQRGGFQGILIRLGDKSAKLNSSFRRMDREGMEDHFVDTAGYALLGLLLLHNQIALPLAEDTEPEPLSGKE